MRIVYTIRVYKNIIHFKYNIRIFLDDLILSISPKIHFNGAQIKYEIDQWHILTI